MEIEVRKVFQACDTILHTIMNLFKCPAKLTQLGEEDFWLQPLKVAEFLNLELDYQISTGGMYCCYFKYNTKGISPNMATYTQIRVVVGPSAMSFPVIFQ